MGRTYRRQDKKFKKKIKEQRRAKQSKRTLGIEEYNRERPKKRNEKDSVGHHLSASSY
jgi:hypothetical protein